MPWPRPLALAALCSLATSASAIDFSAGEGIKGRLNGTLSFGSIVRTEAPDPDNYGANPGTIAGIAPGKLNANYGGSDVNFRRGRPVSTVLKGLFDLELRGKHLSFFARALAWHDFELSAGNRPYGNYANGYRPGAPLGDNGFAPEARFSNGRLADVHVSGGIDLADARLDLRLGRQVVNWGTAEMTGGGINVINPHNLAAQQRPGALPQEGRLPVGMLSLRLNGSNWGIDGFVPYEFRPHVLAGCGSFFDLASFAPTGCGEVAPPPPTEAAAFTSGQYVHRSPDHRARAGGEWGLALRYRAAALDTEFRAYAMNYHNRQFNIRITNPDVGGTYGSFPGTRLSDSNGLKYGLNYVEDLRLYGLSFDTRPDAARRYYGELAYRPRQPINLNASDLIAAFVTRNANSALNLARNTNALAPGAIFDGFDRFRVTTLTLGASRAFSGALGAERLTLAGELGWSHVAGLPDPGSLRYLRPDAYGQAAIDGLPCTDVVPGKTCVHDGFVTSNAWGYRLRLNARYPAALAGATLSPSLLIAHDVRGFAYDGGFQQGRLTLRPALRADWGQAYFAEIAYTRYQGGRYNLLSDRDHALLVVGLQF